MITKIISDTCCGRSSKNMDTEAGRPLWLWGQPGPSRSSRNIWEPVSKRKQIKSLMTVFLYYCKSMLAYNASLHVLVFIHTFLIVLYRAPTNWHFLHEHPQVNNLASSYYNLRNNLVTLSIAPLPPGGKWVEKAAKQGMNDQVKMSSIYTKLTCFEFFTDA